MSVARLGPGAMRQVVGIIHQISSCCPLSPAAREDGIQKQLVASLEDEPQSGEGGKSYVSFAMHRLHMIVGWSA
ncbi:hydrogenase [Anopheles sinensis]|uniref:Hydrogenase n=1 Tax=Anopheles sinensis TaxID=74873 RepID=A0A084WG02_ANOSI|nr:hydrogenase [Anopheles sinensis]